MAGADKSSVELTHFGRKSGKPFTLWVWFVEMGNDVWVGTRDDERSWARNVASNGRVELNFGDGPRPYVGTLGSAAELARFEKAILAKHPVSGRLIHWKTRSKTARCFRLRPAEPPPA